MAKASKAEVFGWAMFDFANSSYTTVIITVVYAVVFPKLIVGDEALGNTLWSVALSIGYGITVVLLPILGALMDRVGHRKRFLFASAALTAVATAALYFATPGMVGLAMLLVVLGNIGFSIGESFIASFLPDLGEPDDLGRISGMAWGLGYVGGLGCTAIVLFGLGPLEADSADALRWIGPITAAWFVVAAVPTFLLLRDRSVPKPLEAGQSLWTAGFHQVATTLRQVGEYRDLAVFFASYVAAMAGLSIVVSFAFIYGDQVIRWQPSTQAAMFVITQITATIGALGFGVLQGRIGDRATYALTLVVWIVSVGLIWGTPSLAEAIRALTGTDVATEHVFLLVGSTAGLCIGGTQSAGRTLVALFSPPSKVGEFFGLWGMFGKLAAIIGLLSVGFLQQQLGLQTAILVCGVFFAAALGIVAFVDVDRGRAQAHNSP